MIHEQNNNRFTVLVGPVVLVDRTVERGMVLISGQVIAYAGPFRSELVPAGCRLIRVSGGHIWPGLVDIHIHGIGGYDVTDGDAGALTAMAEQLARHGVTGFLATTMAAGYPELIRVCRAVRLMETGSSPRGADFLGIHLEGPWIAGKYKGAQREEVITLPSLDAARQLYEEAGGWLRLVTMAPELPGALEVIEYFTSVGVRTAAGHSAARYEEVQQAVSRGLTHVTHCFNAMAGLHHREPGLVGAALVDHRLTAELIADGIHVHPAVMRLLYRMKGRERLALVSDGLPVTGLAAGSYRQGGRVITVQNGEARLADGTLAGSTLTLERAVGRMVEDCRVPLHEAVGMASTVPAAIAGYGHRKGRLAAGYDADMAVVTRDYRVELVMVRGEIVYRLPSARAVTGRAGTG